MGFKFTENLNPVPKISLSCQWFEVRLPSFAIIASTLSLLYRIFNSFFSSRDRLSYVVCVGVSLKDRTGAFYLR